MTLAGFVGTRQDRWKELEALLSRGRGGRLRDISAAELERFGTLYRQATSDLAIARRDFPSADITLYLNDVCARAHPLLYRAPPLRPLDLWQLAAHGVPRAFRARRRCVLLSLGLLVGGLVAGWLAVDLRPDLHASLVPASGFDQLARGQRGSLPSAPLLGTVIITNNIKVAAVCFLGGVLFGVPTAFILASNGWMLGTLAAAVHQGGYDLAFWSLIVPHGVLELSIIIIAGSAGLAIGDSLLRPGLLSRGDSFTAAARGTLALFVGTAILLVLAGLLESYVSPSGLPSGMKLAIGGCVGTALYTWLLLGGRTRPMRGTVWARIPPVGHDEVAA